MTTSSSTDVGAVTGDPASLPQRQRSERSSAASPFSKEEPRAAQPHERLLAGVVRARAVNFFGPRPSADVLSDTCVKLAGWSKTKSWSAVATKSRLLSAIDRFCIPVGSAADGQTTIDVLITVGVVSTPVPSIPPQRQRATSACRRRRGGSAGRSRR